MKLLRSFKYAASGFLYCVKHERNFRIHLVAIAAIITLAIIFELAVWEIAALILAIALVLLAEMVNTAIERTVDAIKKLDERTNDSLNRQCPNGHSGNFPPAGSADSLDLLRKVSKDIAAGAVLVSAIFAAIIGIIIFGARIYEVIWGLLS